MESPETDAIAYSDTKVSAIVSQIRVHVRDVQKIYGSQEGFALYRLDEERQSFIRAQQKWEIAQKDTERRLNMLQSRRDEEIRRLKVKITRYRILDKHGTRIWKEAYKLAKKYEDSPETIDSLDDSVEIQIARDLLANRLGYWFSQDMDEWEDIINERNPMDMV